MRRTRWTARKTPVTITRPPMIVTGSPTCSTSQASARRVRDSGSASTIVRNTAATSPAAPTASFLRRAPRLSLRATTTPARTMRRTRSTRSVPTDNAIRRICTGPIANTTADITPATSSSSHLCARSQSATSLLSRISTSDSPISTATDSQFSTRPTVAGTPPEVIRKTAGTDNSAATSTGIASRSSQRSARSCDEGSRRCSSARDDMAVAVLRLCGCSVISGSIRARHVTHSH